jgi:hypothetical protein
MKSRHEKKFPTTKRARSWWRRLLVENWSLKLLALAITMVLWFMVSGRVAEREIAVEPKLEGKPAPNFEVKQVVATPAVIKVQGAAERLNVLERVQTQPISIEGRRESFEVEHAAVYISDPNVAALGRVHVRVTIVASENSKSKTRDTN